MQLLITKADIAQYKQISGTPHEAKLKECILDAQLLDMQPLLGERLYNKIVATPGDYADLMNGGSYVHDGETYHNNGLKMVLSYFAYARYIYFGSALDTPFGLVEKLNPDSRPVEVTSKKSIYVESQKAAAQLWESVKNYLIRTKLVEYPGCNNQPARTSIKFKKIG